MAVTAETWVQGESVAPAGAAYASVIVFIDSRLGTGYTKALARGVEFGEYLLNAPSLFSLSVQTGQARTPVDLLLDAGTVTVAGCYIGHTEDETLVIEDFLAHAVSDLTWTLTGGGAASGAAYAETAGYPNGAGNNIVWATNHATGDTASITTTDLPAGAYLVLANCKYITAAAGVEIKHQFGEWTPVTTSALRLLPLGVVSLPVRAGRGSFVDTLEVSIRGNNTNYAAVNYFVLLPVTGGLTGYVLPSGHVHTLRWEDGTLYAADAVDLEHVFGSSRPLRALGGQLLVLAENATAAPTVPLNVTASATPRWEQLPSAAGLRGDGSSM
jgi:hypothetical protein